VGHARIEFVPDDQLHRQPALEVREPDPVCVAV